MRLVVCPLSKLDATLAAHRPSRLVTLVRLDPPLERPEGIAPGHHLTLPFNDIAAPRPGFVAPKGNDVERLLAFAAAWDRAAPLLLHCFAGISRSTAAAYVIACAFDPARDEAELAAALRAAAPSATPNPLVVALADATLGRQGRMVAAIKAIGRGADAYEGAPFALPVPAP